MQPSQHAHSRPMRWWAMATDSVDAHRQRELARAVNYPLARWYLRPAAGWLAGWLAPSELNPCWLTGAGLLCALIATGLLWQAPTWTAAAALLVLLAWFFDRADGQLARRRGAASARGAWFDANVDEASDLLLHLGVAAAAAARLDADWPWALLLAFFGGKYLLMYGLLSAEGLATETAGESPPRRRRAIDSEAAASPASPRPRRSSSQRSSSPRIPALGTGARAP